MPKKDNIHLVIPENNLRERGFTSSGITNYIESINYHANELMTKAIKLAKIEKAKNSSLEVTHEHVRSANTKIYPKQYKPGWTYITIPLEYVSFVVSALGVGNLNESWGVYSFVTGLLIGVSLIIIRIIKKG